MKIFAAIILAGLIIFLATQIYGLAGKRNTLQSDFADLKGQLDSAKADASSSQADVNYYLNPLNLEKELRARFNYKAPDEKMIILVPGNASNTASSTTSQ